MTMKRRTPSRLIETVHETARDLQTAGFIDKRRMREYDALCFAPVPPYACEDIQALRARYKLSQAVLVS